MADVRLRDKKTSAKSVSALDHLFQELDKFAEKWNVAAFSVFAFSPIGDHAKEQQSHVHVGQGEPFEALIFDRDIRFELEAQNRRLERTGHLGFEGPSLVRHHDLVGMIYLLSAVHQERLAILIWLAEDRVGPCVSDCERLLASTVSLGMSRLETLSRKELDVIQWLSEGKTSSEVGSILNISEFVVNEHIRASMRKLNSSNRINLIAKSLRMGIIN